MDLHTTLITIIAFSAVLTVLSVIFHWLLTPVKDNQARLEQNQARLEKNQARLEENMQELKSDMRELKQAVQVLLKRA